LLANAAALDAYGLEYTLVKSKARGGIMIALADPFFPVV